MAKCSLYTPKAYPIISRSEMDSIILFERVERDWVREVHRHSSNTKKGTNYVVFRNSENKKFSKLQHLIEHWEHLGYNVSYLRTAVFKYDKHPDILANRVGANKVAKLEARKWVKDVTQQKERQVERDETQ